MPSLSPNVRYLDNSSEWKILNDEIPFLNRFSIDGNCWRSQDQVTLVYPFDSLFIMVYVLWDWTKQKTNFLLRVRKISNKWFCPYSGEVRLYLLQVKICKHLERTCNFHYSSIWWKCWLVHSFVFVQNTWDGNWVTLSCFHVTWKDIKHLLEEFSWYFNTACLCFKESE